MSSPYEGNYHWNKQKEAMLNSLLQQGVPMDRAQAQVAKIAQIQADAGNIPAGHPDSISDVMQASVGVPEPPAQLSGPSTPSVPPPPQASGPMGPPATAQQAPSIAAPSSPGIAEPSAGMGSVFDNADAVDSILGMGGIDRQMAQAEALRDKAGPQGRGGLGTRNTYVAANPLEHISSGVEKYRAKKDIKRLDVESKDARKALIELLRNRKSTPPIMPGGGPLV